MPELPKWFRSVALVRRIVDGKHRWLARTKGSESQLGFITAQRLERESFRESIRREVAWVLELNAQKDFLVSNMAQLNLEFVARLPEDDAESHVAVAFFVVDIYRKQALQIVNQQPANVWLSSSEVCAGLSNAGIKLDPRLVFLLDRAGVINSWD